MSQKKQTKRKPRKPRAGLTEQEEAYCRAYALNGGNGAEAVATSMPYTRKWAGQSRAVRSSKLLSKAKVRERISELGAIAREKANADFAMSAEEVIHRLTLMGRANLRHYIELDAKGRPTIVFRATDDDQFYALGEVSVEDIETGRRRGKRTKVKLPDRIAALKLLGLQHGMFKQDVRVSGTQPIPVTLLSAEAAL